MDNFHDIMGYWGGTNPNINNEVFDRPVTLRDAYRTMIQFLRELDERGAVDTEWILHVYADLMDNGETPDPAALPDFLEAASAVEAFKRA